MRRIRALYHYAIGRVKRNAENIMSDGVADAMILSNARNFWSEITRIRSSKSVNSCTVDNQTEPSNIATVFNDNYHESYTSDINDRSINSR